MYAKKQRLEGIRCGPEVSRCRKSKMHDEPRATAHPQQRADDIDGTTQTGGHTEAQRPQAAGAVPGRSVTSHSATSQRTPCVTCPHDKVAPAMFLMSASKRS